VLINETETETFSFVEKEVHIDITEDLLLQSLNELFSNFSLQVIILLRIIIIFLIVVVGEIISHLNLFDWFDFFQGDIISLRLSQFTLR
jgi:hypothetical protein